MLRQQVLAIVIPVRRSNDSMDMVSSWCARCIYLRCAHRILMVELDQNYRAMYSIVEDCVVFCVSNPGKVGLSNMLTYLVHSYIGMGLAHVRYVDSNQI